MEKKNLSIGAEINEPCHTLRWSVAYEKRIALDSCCYYVPGTCAQSRIIIHAGSNNSMKCQLKDLKKYI